VTQFLRLGRRDRASEFRSCFAQHRLQVVPFLILHFYFKIRWLILGPKKRHVNCASSKNVGQQKIAKKF
jgi:hypothetical protein